MDQLKNSDLANEISVASRIQFATPKGTANAFLYPAHNSEYSTKEATPVIAICHGGPTGQTDDSLNFKIQYWTNRGFAVVDVNYHGSTGSGRAYRHSLNGNWGVTDVEDMCAAIDFLKNHESIDADKAIIKGSSAGGYTVLAALTFTKVFKAGVSLYGIGDLELLAQDTHKFEAKYLDTLVGSYSEEKEQYVKRSPINYPEKITCPTLLFQGLEDKVVPPNQAQSIAKAIEKNGIPVALVEYPEEGHGFRSAETIEHMLKAELYFYQHVFKFDCSTQPKFIDISNMESN